MYANHSPGSRTQEIAADAIVVGGSAGSIDVLRAMLTALPVLDIPIVVVIHLPMRAPARLHEVLNASVDWTIKQAEDKEPLQGGVVYLAPPGYHLLIETDRTLALSVDEPVYYSRPSIDVLFESARDTYDGRLIGVLLSGASGDGSSGLREIHRAGGTTIVQSPASAEAAAMPKAALALIEPTYVLSPPEIAQLFSCLSSSKHAGAR